MKALALVLVALAAALAAAEPTVYLIRHGEKPADDKERGLSEQGKQRAECLRHVFGISSGYNISHIMAQAYFKSAFAASRRLSCASPCPRSRPLFPRPKSSVPRARRLARADPTRRAQTAAAGAPTTR